MKFSITVFDGRYLNQSSLFIYIHRWLFRCKCFFYFVHSLLSFFCLLLRYFHSILFYVFANRNRSLLKWTVLLFFCPFIYHVYGIDGINNSIELINICWYSEIWDRLSTLFFFSSNGYWKCSTTFSLLFFFFASFVDFFCFDLFFFFVRKYQIRILIS